MWDFAFKSCKAQLARLLGAWKAYGQDQDQKLFCFSNFFLTNKKSLKGRGQVSNLDYLPLEPHTHRLASKGPSDLSVQKLYIKKNILKLLWIERKIWDNKNNALRSRPRIEPGSFATRAKHKVFALRTNSALNLFWLKALYKYNI